MLTVTSRRLIGASVEDDLDAVLWQLVDGEVELHQLTPGLAGFWSLAYDQGRASRQAEIDRANADADRYYRAAYDSLALRNQRFDVAAARYWNEWLDGQHDVDQHLPAAKAA